MNLSISNIAWEAGQDDQTYNLMKKYGFTGLEIAPTRIFSEAPYEKLEEASLWSEKLKEEYGFVISSMQSIWYGKHENIFGTDDEFDELIAYTKKAIIFASVIGCKNLVFGCPGNRNMRDGADPDKAVRFFREIGNFAADHGTIIGMEANPPIYNTNYINDTVSALKLIEQVNSEGFKLNLDLGTMLYNHEDMSELKGNVHFINHVHISEPGLKPIEKREFHTNICHLLKEETYGGFISIEVGKVGEITALGEMISYVGGIFQ